MNAAVDPVVDLALRAALALLFAAAAVHKLSDPTRFRAAVAEYHLLPVALVPVAAVGLVALEATLVAALVIARSIGLAGSALVLMAYAGAIAVNLGRGRRDLDCGCLGAGGREHISWWLVGRNLGLATVALAALRPVAARGLVWVDGLTVVGALVVAAFTWLAADGLLANRTGVARIRGAA